MRWRINVSNVYVHIAAERDYTLNYTYIATRSIIISQQQKQSATTRVSCILLRTFSRICASKCERKQGKCAAIIKPRKNGTCDNDILAYRTMKNSVSIYFRDIDMDEYIPLSLSSLFWSVSMCIFV